MLPPVSRTYNNVVRAYIQHSLLFAHQASAHGSPDGPTARVDFCSGRLQQVQPCNLLRLTQLFPQLLPISYPCLLDLR